MISELWLIQSSWSAVFALFVIWIVLLLLRSVCDIAASRQGIPSEEETALLGRGMPTVAAWHTRFSKASSSARTTFLVIHE
jgi:hypothetical protein